MVKSKSKKKSQKQKEVKAPLAISKIGTSPVPIINGSSGMRVHHREFITAITGIGSGHAINSAGYFQPGDFIWLQPFATRFEAYVVNSAKLIFVSRCAATVGGEVGIRFDSDVYDQAPDGIRDFISGGIVKTAPPWTNFELPIPRQALDMYKKRYCRVGAEVPYSADRRLYDSGQFWVLTVSNGTSNDLGYLEIEYDITFYTNQIQLIASGSVTSPTPAHSGDDYGIDRNASDYLVKGKLPLEVSMPTAEDVTNGAKAGIAILKALRNWEGKLDLFSEGTSATMASNVRSYKSGAVSLGKDLPNLSSSENVSLWKVVFNGIGSWLQPYVTDATNPVTKVELNLAPGRYSDFV